MPLNLHEVFNKKGADESLLPQLIPPSDIVQFLRGLRADVKLVLSEGIPRWFEKNLGVEAGVKPRFMTQGSWAYNTCNMPAKSSQEIDLDYGVYLPVQGWDDASESPKHAAKLYFEMVKEVLSPWVRKEGYQFQQKDTCVRVVVPGRKVHLDIPLYVAPASEFPEIKEVVILDEANAGKRILASLSTEKFSEDEKKQWAALKHIQLAMRTDDGFSWKKSDPREVHEWFKGISAQYPQIVPVCRYLKAWRDHEWIKGGPSSIVLMICAVQAYQALSAAERESFNGRDDLALREVVRSLSVRLGGDVKEPGINGEQFNRLDSSDRRDAAYKAKNLFDVMDSCIAKCTVPYAALDELRGVWGERITEDENLVQIEALPESEVMHAQPTQQRKPVSDRTQAG